MAQTRMTQKRRKRLFIPFRPNALPGFEPVRKSKEEGACRSWLLPRRVFFLFFPSTNDVAHGWDKLRESPGSFTDEFRRALPPYKIFLFFFWPPAGDLPPRARRECRRLALRADTAFFPPPCVETADPEEKSRRSRASRPLFWLFFFFSRLL